MKTTIINTSNVDDFADILTINEIIAIEDERLSSLGAYNEEDGDAEGVLVAEIYEEFMEIKGLRVKETYKNQGIEKRLLDIALDLPDEMKLSVFSFNPENVDLLIEAGFKEQKSDYYYVSGTLGDLVDVTAPKAINKGTELTTLNVVTDREFGVFFNNKKVDEFFQFPEKVPVRSRFSDGSIVCRVNKKVVALILIEELNEFLRVTYFYGDNPESLYLCFSVLKKVLKNDYEDDLQLKFLACNGKEKNNIIKLFNNAKCEKVRMYKFDK